MRVSLRWLFWLGAISALAFALGPVEPFEQRLTFAPELLGDDPDAWLAEKEATVPDLRPGLEKEIIWADPQSRTRTPLAIVYIHGFSASKEETRPLADNLATELGANLFYTRLAGHGRDGAAMAEPTADDWYDDAAEALEIGRRIGDKVLVIGTSTGATVATVALSDPDLAYGVIGFVGIAPNYLLNRFVGRLLMLPWARYWLPPFFGYERGFTPETPEQANAWTTRYPSVAVAPMAAIMKAAERTDLNQMKAPALFIFADEDIICDHTRTREVAANWGAGAETRVVTPGPRDSPHAHIIAGDIFSPGLTPTAQSHIANFVNRLSGKSAINLTANQE